MIRQVEILAKQRPRYKQRVLPDAPLPGDLSARGRVQIILRDLPGSVQPTRLHTHVAPGAHGRAEALPCKVKLFREPEGAPSRTK